MSRVTESRRLLDEEDEEDEEDEDEDMDDSYNESVQNREQERYRRLRIFWIRLHWKIRFILIGIYKRYFVVPPDIQDMCHYAQCESCRRLLKHQGWDVEFRVSKENRIYEVTFRYKERKVDERRLSLYV